MARIVIHARALHELKRSPAVVALLQEKVDRITAAANEPGTDTGDGFAGGVDVNPSGARGYIVTKNQHGMFAEAKDRRLTRAIDAGR